MMCLAQILKHMMFPRVYSGTKNKDADAAYNSLTIDSPSNLFKAMILYILLFLPKTLIPKPPDIYSGQTQS